MLTSGETQARFRSPCNPLNSFIGPVNEFDNQGQVYRILCAIICVGYMYRVIAGPCDLTATNLKMGISREGIHLFIVIVKFGGHGFD